MRVNYLYQGVKGMRDVFPEEASRYQLVEQAARRWFCRYGYGEIRTPMVEPTALFERGVGQGTDIVNKEMFYVPAKDTDAEGQGDPLKRMVLRPEATAAVARAYIEHEIDKMAPGVQRYYYIGPMFRYERPQRGRLRQFTQIGIELLGSSSPDADAEALVLLHDLLADLQLQGLILHLNSVGCPACRPGYVAALLAFMRQQATTLCSDCQARMDKNPLRLFDCKQAGCGSVLAGAPDIQAFLCPDCQSHQTAVLTLVQRCGIQPRLAPRLMRGLDYYSRTVFEITSSELGAQNAVAAGGRYDRLVEELDGPPTPAVGWSLGLERLLEVAPQMTGLETGLDIYVVSAGPDWGQTFERVTALRRQGVRVGLEMEGKSVKALMKRANRLGARFVLLVSETEPGTVALKDMSTGGQVDVAWETILQHIGHAPGRHPA